ncbi:hypothetical protein V6N12_057103 [Hibiscus sabdariffa]|uniref:U-box domain-containing protein n=1 Tax=Hibiscus sabdariffa TaxID=183260 RepID=A0ABR2DD56_9ROSI
MAETEYNRDIIEHWLLTCKNTTSPVTQQPLPPDSDLTPNHTLRHLIQSWCIENASLGVDRILTPKPFLDKSHCSKLTKQLWHPDSKMKYLQELDFLAAKNERNMMFMVEIGLPRALFSFVVKCFEQNCIYGIEEALRVLFSFRFHPLKQRFLFEKTIRLSDH